MSIHCQNGCFLWKMCHPRAIRIEFVYHLLLIKFINQKPLTIYIFENKTEKKNNISKLVKLPVSHTKNTLFNNKILKI